MPDGLEVSPDDELSFILSPKEATPKAVLTLKHPVGSGGIGEPIAFKVKTTQPRRYLVRPNQGLIQPGQTEQIQILLVEKDKISLWQSYERLGQSALDSSKDKFLVQSCKVTPEEKLTANDYEKLSNFWTKVMSNTSSHGVFNTKLPVRLIAKEENAEIRVAPSASAAPPASTAPSKSVTKSMPKPATSGKDPSSMTSDQLRSELINLRGKYDELVSFSVNLTAERDILNNTLEQTKRELNKYVYKSAANDNRSNVDGANGAAGANSEKSGFNQLFYITAFVFWMLGCWMTHRGQTRFLSHVPLVSSFFPVLETVPISESKIERKIKASSRPIPAKVTPVDDDEDDSHIEL
ncbi:hypothetical protein ACA910_008515 [Epithemia clementina (nom. ined.)]